MRHGNITKGVKHPEQYSFSVIPSLLNNSESCFHQGCRRHPLHCIISTNNKALVFFSTSRLSFCGNCHAPVQKDDVILKINDVEIEDSTHLKYILYKYSVGDTVKLEYERDGKTNTVEVKLNKAI